MKMVIMGPAGKMGRAMVAAVVADPELELAGAVAPSGRDYLGDDAGVVAGLGRRVDVPVTHDLDGVLPGADCLLDCTNPATAMAALDRCLARGVAFVTGTTGFSAEERARLEAAGETIPVILAYNTARLFNLLFDAVGRVASKLGPEVDVDIIDMHDNQKIDAPSGTAKEIAGIVGRELDLPLETATCGRQGMEARQPGTLAFNSIRSGGYPGSVKVIFGLENEKLELSASVYNMETYARGMVDAGRYLKDKGPGWYDLKSVFGM